MEGRLIGQLMGDPAYRDLAHVDVVAQREADLAALAGRTKQAREGAVEAEAPCPVSRPGPRLGRRQIVQSMWDRGETLGDIQEATRLTLAQVYAIVKEADATQKGTVSAHEGGQDD